MTISYSEPVEPVSAKVSSNGQISIPAEIRRRWGSEQMMIIDEGDFVIVAPLVDDIIGSLRGIFAADGAGPSSADYRAAERELEESLEAQRQGRRRDRS
jgi:AbrB family looped-hinge helix DNA binding protein